MDQANFTSPDAQAIKAPLNPVAVGLAIFFFFPLGLYLLWKHPVLSRNKRWWWVGGIWSFFVLVSAMNGDKDKKPETAEVTQASTARTTKANEEPLPSQPVATTEEDVAENEPPALTTATKPKKVKKGINLENYERITDGMSREEVEAMLGKGTEISSSGGIKNVGYRSRNLLTGSQRIVSIVYEDSVVIGKSKLGF